jgi:hypothetical protein
MRIKNPKLFENYTINNNLTINGLERYSCEICLYTPNNMFYILPPKYVKDNSCVFWDIGFLDVKNIIFYETGYLSSSEFEKNLYFYEWTALLQLIIDKKVYSKLFETFGFEKGVLVENDRQLHEPAFFQGIRGIINEIFSAEFLVYVCDLMKRNGRMISYTVFKKKIASNLKNFKELKLTTQTSFKFNTN